MNLAFCDFLFCCNYLLQLISWLILDIGWYFGPTICIISAILRYIITCAEWMSVAIIAVIRCLVLTKIEIAEKYLSGYKKHAFIGLIWFYALILMIPFSFSDFGSFGYDCHLANCDFLPTEKGMQLIRFYFVVTFSLPCTLILISYGIFLKHILTHSSFLKIHATTDVKKAIAKRELKTTWTLILVCTCFIVFVGPLALLYYFFKTSLPSAEVDLLIFSLYWCQYSLNFVIYAAKSEQYRKA